VQGPIEKSSGAFALLADHQVTVSITGTDRPGDAMAVLALSDGVPRSRPGPVRCRSGGCPPTIGDWSNLAGAIVRADWPGLADAAVGPRRYRGTLLAAAGNTDYHYDAEGTVARRRLGRSWHYRWNADGRLAGVVAPDGQHWRYRYDALGRRIAKQRVDAQGRVAEQTEFTWDGTKLAEEVRSGTGQAAVTVVWEWAPGAERPVTQTERVLVTDGVDERFHAIVTDLVGSPSELLDGAGAVSWHLHTSLWGKVLSPPGRAYTPLRFPGQYHDAETGLHYNLHRYYDPDTGRYLSHDPLGLEPAPDSLAYVSNPTGWIDPLGLAVTTPCSSSGGGKGGGKKPPGKKPNPISSLIAKMKQPKQSYAPGTHGAKKREQDRLNKLFDNDLKAQRHGKVSGNTHQSEHPIGYEVLGRGSGDGRGSGNQQKNLENHAWAYQEDLASHRAHIGTGTSSRTADSGFTAQSYRDSQRTALEGGDPNTAIQLNQLDYAHQTEFKNSKDTVGGKIAEDSYHNMVDNAQGKGIQYATGPGANATTPPLSFMRPVTSSAPVSTRSTSPTRTSCRTSMTSTPRRARLTGTPCCGAISAAPRSSTPTPWTSTDQLSGWASFDLIHTRYVVLHLPDQDATIARLVFWPAPGGVLLLEEPAIFPVQARRTRPTSQSCWHSVTSWKTPSAPTRNGLRRCRHLYMDRA
jgi:RHS repeat-associated protein